MRLELTDPMPHGVEGLLACAVVGKDNAVCFVKVLHCHSTEPLLAGGVPHKQLDILPIDLKILDLEIDTHCSDVVSTEAIVRETLKETRLAYFGVPQCDKLDLHIELLRLAPGSAA